jgi:hypothetical protein
MLNKGAAADRGPMPEKDNEVTGVWYLGNGEIVLSNGIIIDDVEEKAKYVKMIEEDAAWDTHEGEVNRAPQDHEREVRSREVYPEGSEINIRENVTLPEGKTFGELRVALKELDDLDAQRQSAQEEHIAKNYTGDGQKEIDRLSRLMNAIREDFGLDEHQVYVGEIAAEVLDGDESGVLVYGDSSSEDPTNSSTTIVVRHGDKVLRYHKTSSTDEMGVRTLIESSQDAANRKGKSPLVHNLDW